jgi:hypothetical protein
MVISGPLVDRSSLGLQLVLHTCRQHATYMVISGLIVDRSPLGLHFPQLENILHSYVYPGVGFSSAPAYQFLLITIIFLDNPL